MLSTPAYVPVAGAVAVLRVGEGLAKGGLYRGFEEGLSGVENV
jgi:hypothetical protein